MNVYSKFSAAAAIAEFDKQNGGRAESLRSGSWIWYSNGATREVDPLGAMIDPPSDEFARLTNVVIYRQARLNEAIRAFDNLKHNLLGGHPDGGEALSELKRQQATVSERNAELEAAKQNLANTEEGKRREAGRLLDAEMHAKRQQFKGELQAVRIQGEDEDA